MKIKVYVYPEASLPKWPDGSEYQNSDCQPFSPVGIAKYVEQVSPEEADYFYMGSFYYVESMKGKYDWNLERFPYLDKCPERHLVDLEGDWDLRELHPAIRKCLITIIDYDQPVSSSPNVFIRGLWPPTLLPLLTKCRDKFEFTPDRVRFGFKGNINNWVRMLLPAYFGKWDMDVDYFHHHGVNRFHEVKDYENFFMRNGLALCPRGCIETTVNTTMRFFEACFFTCVPIVVADRIPRLMGDDHWDTDFFYYINCCLSECEMREAFEKILATPFEELQRKAMKARQYFDVVWRFYYGDATGCYVRWLKWKGYPVYEETLG